MTISGSGYIDFDGTNEYITVPYQERILGKCRWWRTLLRRGHAPKPITGHWYAHVRPTGGEWHVRTGPVPMLECEHCKRTALSMSIGKGFDGKIDQVAVFARALTDEQIIASFGELPVPNRVTWRDHGRVVLSADEIQKLYEQGPPA